MVLPVMSGGVIRNLEELLEGAATGRLRAMRRIALDMFEAALGAVDPERAVRRHLRRERGTLSIGTLRLNLDTIRSVRMIAFGKASLSMARAVLDTVDVEEGLIVADEKKRLKHPGIEVVKAGHPHPDEGSLQAGEKALRIAKKCGSRDLLLVLVSGGGSSMLEASDLSVEELHGVSDLLIKSGMDILRLNTVRKHLSEIKGGQLGKTAASRGGITAALIVSDVVGDPPSFIASGPTVADETTYVDAKRVLEEFALWGTVPNAVRRRVEAGVKGVLQDTPKPGEPCFERVHNIIIARNRMACEAAAKVAGRKAYRPMILTNRLQGESREVGRVLAAIAVSLDEESLPLRKPAALLTGGETTVTVRGAGKGGRNQELLLAAVPFLSGRDVVMVSCGTDGRDGETDAAGAIADGETLRRAKELDINPADYLQRNDSHAFFRRLDDTVVTGPTGTNVMDLQIILAGCPNGEDEREGA